MSHQLISRSPHLLSLRNEGYDLDTKEGYLLVRDVPYVNAERQVCKGVLVMALNLVADIAGKPSDHTAHFIGDRPCDSQGRPLEEIINNSNANTLLPDLVVNHYFSAKLRGSEYADYYQKVSIYVSMLAGQAQAIDPSVTAKTFAPVRSDMEDTKFAYTDTASPRAGIAMATQRFKGLKIAIVGLGGTGAYILDQVSKTPVAEIHLYDGDLLQQHNAFRYPGAVPFTTLERGLKKVEYLHEAYSQMHLGITQHPTMITAANVGELRQFDYVFLCVDNTAARAMVVRELKGTRTSLLDVGMGVHLVDGTQQVWGTCRVTALKPDHHDHASRTMPLTENEAEDAYRSNIQIADLNALNAVLAVGMWKRLCGFYVDNCQAGQVTYSTNLNEMGNSEKEEDEL